MPSVSFKENPMNEVFKITPSMEAEIENEVSQALHEVSHDTPREVFGAPRIRRRPPDRVGDSLRSEQGLENDLEAVQRLAEPDQTDPVNHPRHYTSHPSGVECITVTEWMSFNLGNAVKHIWRAGMKGYQIEDLRKARWYIDRELKRLGAEE